MNCKLFFPLICASPYSLPSTLITSPAFLSRLYKIRRLLCSRCHAHLPLFSSRLSPSAMAAANHASLRNAKPRELVKTQAREDDEKRRMTALEKPSFMAWTMEDVRDLARYHPIPCVFAMFLLFFMGVEYTLSMVPASSPPYDLGFHLTLPLHRLLALSPALNSALAALNTVFVGMQTTYILWTWLVEGRPRATTSALFMFTCRGILGCSTQLPLPQGFLGSGLDFPVGNVSFFLFFSGHVAGSVIASLDMRRMNRREMAWLFDALNALQGVRLLSTRGHYTIDLAVGVGAGYLFDSLAGKYEDCKRKSSSQTLHPFEAKAQQGISSY